MHVFGHLNFSNQDHAVEVCPGIHNCAEWNSSGSNNFTNWSKNISPLFVFLFLLNRFIIKIAKTLKNKNNKRYYFVKRLYFLLFNYYIMYVCKHICIYVNILLYNKKHNKYDNEFKRKVLWFKVRVCAFVCDAITISIAEVSYILWNCLAAFLARCSLWYKLSCVFRNESGCINHDASIKRT